MRKYYAVVRRPNYAKPIAINIISENDRRAIDDMYYFSGATKAEDISEYMLYEVVGPNRYRPVSSKPAESPPSQCEDESKYTFTEKVYQSYKDAA